MILILPENGWNLSNTHEVIVTGTAMLSLAAQLRLLALADNYLLLFHILTGLKLFRYRTRRDRSRSLSRSPIRGRQRDRSQSRSPRQSRSPLERQKPTPSNRIQSRLGPQGHDFRSAGGHSRSKSPSLSKYRSDAGRAPTADKGRSRSSSPNEANGLVAYGDGSP